MLKDDNRKRMLDKVIKQFNYEESSLLEILHKAQEFYGYLDKNLMTYISDELRLPPSHVVGVATFYSYFKLKAPGEHVVTGCLGTACYVKAVDEIMTAIEKEFNLKRGGSTPDGKLSLFTTRCIGACAMAPNIIVDDEVIGKATKEVVLERVRLTLAGGGRRR
ncbi:MAG: NAD(P)H-dependent oxidoreductase subunit E [Candidatus Bathyarchaeota archaeon]|nr:NAD(P)H-dependent oxidoreductase subunit E [Candidatus Bathyarchaeota archaeon]